MLKITKYPTKRMSIKELSANDYMGRGKSEGKMFNAEN